MVPEYRTSPVRERSKWLSIVIQGLGPTALVESWTPFGTVLIILSKTLKQVSSKLCGVDIALIVALLSELKIRRSERKSVLLVVTRGPPAWPDPLRYSAILTLSKMAGVLSK